MGMDPHGILAYGYDLGTGENWKLVGAGEYGDYDFPWWNDDSPGGWAETAKTVLLAKLAGFTETWDQVYKTPRQDGFGKRLGLAELKLRVEIVEYGTSEYCGYILATTVLESDDYDATPVEISFDHAAAGILDVALAALEITPIQKEPKWILASYYG